MMKISLLFAIAFVLQATALCKDLRAQNLEEYIENNCAGYLVINSPGDLLGEITKSGFFELQEFFDTLEIGVDSGVLGSEDELEELRDLGERLSSQLEMVEELAIVFHVVAFSPKGKIDIPNSSLSMLISVSDGKAQALSDLGGQFLKNGHLPKSQSLLANTAKDFFSQWNVFKQGNQFIISSGTKESVEFSNRFATSETNFRSLSKSRSFLRTQKSIEIDSPHIRGFLNPRNTSELIARLIDKQFEKVPVREVSGIGFAAALNPAGANISTAECQLTPVVEFQVAVTYTVPPSGFAGLLASRTPISIPKLPFNTLSLSSHGYDQKARFEARSELRRKQEIEQTWEERISSKFETYGIELNTALDRTNQFLSVYDSDFGFLMLERVQDHDAMKEYFLGMIENDNRRTPEAADLISLECDTGLRYGRTKERVTEYLKFTGQSDSLENGVVPEEVFDTQWEYLLTNDWMVRATRFNTERMIEGLSDPYMPAKEIGLLLKDLKNSFSLSELVGIEYRSSEWLDYSATLFEFDRIKLKYKDSFKKRNEILFKKQDARGLRNLIESQADAIAAMKTLIGRGFARTFGTVIFVVTKQGNSVSLVGRIYSRNEKQSKQ